MPKVSFLALCFNHEPYLKTCLDSVLAQRWPNSELIILDNASIDDSAFHIKQWAIQSAIRPKLLMQSERRGVCANINTLISHATGDYVAVIATDDYWYPMKTSSQVAALEALGPEYAVAYSDATCIDALGHTIPPHTFIEAHRQFDDLPQGDILLELLRAPFIPAMSTLIRRSALVDMGPYDESLIYEDYDAWLRLADRWKFHADPAPLCAYRVLKSSMIRTVAAQDKPEKILSDARIMAKCSNIPRLPTKACINTKRRVVHLVMQLLAMPGDWNHALQELHQMTHIQTLEILRKAHLEYTTIPYEGSQKILADAVKMDMLPTQEQVLLPKSILMESTKPFPPPTPPTKAWWKLWQ